MQVIVENVANLAALGEYSCGIAQGERNFVFVNIGRGVGAGLIIDGQVHRGPEWTAGEIGYLPVPGTRVPIRKSQVGALEAAIGTCAIEREWREMTAAARLRRMGRPEAPARFWIEPSKGTRWRSGLSTRPPTIWPWSAPASA